ncbi:GAF domain-containing protein [Amycolatopsis benzoatilytica]|uniref:sensor histidine kinase n=1 Tax=Amycolatopsis benzoatilytica TaxID=346045 RepID=UPI00037E9E0F|nr:GAF domain-containing protein [Amycolatopsis benzoatilytica]
MSLEHEDRSAQSDDPAEAVPRRGWPAEGAPATGLAVPERVRRLLDAVMNLGSGLELPRVLREIVEAAAGLTEAEYGALGIVGDGRRLAEFLPVGMSDELIAQLGPPPCGHGILGELIRRPEPLRLADLTRHPSSHGFPENHPMMRTFLGVPVRVQDEVFGNLYLTQKRGGREFDEEDEAVLATLATAAGIAIEHARMYHESRRRERWLEALNEITRSILAGSDPRDVLRLIARRAHEVADADLVSVLLPADDGRHLRVEVADGDDAALVEGSVVPAGRSLAGLAARTGAPVVSRDVAADPRAHPLGAADRGRPVVAVPLPIDADACGALRLSRSAGGPRFDETETRLISGFAGQAALALELGKRRAESEELALLHDRDRIARDMHDLVVQRLFATVMALQGTAGMTDPAKIGARVSRAVDDLDTTIEVIRSTIFALRIDGSFDGGASLRRRMPETVRMAAQSLGFSPALRIEGPVDFSVDAELAEHILAVTAEALSNVARHACASRADIVLSAPADGNALILVVTDDGKGTAAAGGSGGLANMRSRAGLCGGTLSVESPLSSAGGTRIVWQVPLPDD